MGQDPTAVKTPEASRNRRLRMPRFHTFDSLASKDFRLLWAGSFFDNMAVWLQLLSLTSLVYDLTESAMYAGVAGGLRGLPTLFIGPWAGVAADRIDRRMLVLVSQVLLVLAAAGFVAIVFLGTVQVWHALAYAAVSSICFAFIMPIRQALVVNTTPPGNLGNAYALSAMTVTVNRFIGGLLFAGLLLVTGDIKWNFVVEGAAYLVTALLLIPMRTPYAEKSTASRGSVLNNLTEGVKYIWTENPIILHLIILSFILTWVFLPVPVLLAPYTSRVLETGSRRTRLPFVGPGSGRHHRHPGDCDPGVCPRQGEVGTNSADYRLQRRSGPGPVQLAVAVAGDAGDFRNLPELLHRQQ